MRQPEEYMDQFQNADMDTLPNVASTTDMTGLIPSGIEKEEEIEAYEEMYYFLPPGVEEK